MARHNDNEITAADSIVATIAQCGVNEIMSDDNGLNNAMHHISNVMDFCSNIEALRFPYFLTQAVVFASLNGKDHSFANIAGDALAEVVEMNNHVSSNLHSLKIIGNFLSGIYEELEKKMEETGNTGNR